MLCQCFIAVNRVGKPRNRRQVRKQPRGLLRSDRPRICQLFPARLDEHLYQAVTVARADAVLAASIFHFGEISIPEAKRYLKEKGIPVKIS